MIFLDIGKYSINLDHVTHICREDSGTVSIELDARDGDGSVYITLRGDEAIAFKAWWDRHRKIPELTIVGL